MTERAGLEGCWPRVLVAASLLAAAEFGLTLTLGRFLDWDRAEPLLFFAFRPWVLLAAALVAARRNATERWLLYGASLLLAASAETLFLRLLGSADPWSASARGLLAGLGLALVFDLLVQAGRRFGRAGFAAAALAGLALLLVPGALRPYETLALGSEPRPAIGPKPQLMLFTALPIIWGEGGAFDPDARPAASYRYLQREFQVRPLDTLEPASLRSGRLLLIAQARALAPNELVALDQWVRRGGQALILTDPALLWPSELPLGDVRRPPAIGLLDPLLRHWGLRIVPRGETEPQVEPLVGAWKERRLVVAGTGRFVATGPSCRVGLPATFAHCRIGLGQAWLVADADLMNDALWTSAAGGEDLRRRTADNPLLIADWLDALAGLKRERVASPIQWNNADASPADAVLVGLLPLLIAGVAGLILRVRRR